MTQFPSKSYRFDDFVFNGEKLALYHRNRLIKNTDKKSLQVLAVLLENANQLTSHDEIVERVWKDNTHGVNSMHIAQYIGKLRKVLRENEPHKKYIENIKGRGYMFVGELVSEESNFTPEFVSFSSTGVASNPQTENTTSDEDVTQDSPVNSKTALFVLIPTILLLSFLVWLCFPQNDENEIRRVVEESQKFESLVLYRNPQAVTDSDFEKYWFSGTGFESDLDITKIHAGVQRLINEGKYYGDESKCELFEIQSVEINKERDFAIVKTLEKWFLAEYFNDGTLNRNKTVGPYFVSYTLRKINGQWLIEKSTTARAKPSPNSL